MKKKPIPHNGVEYPSQGALAKALGVARSTTSRAIKAGRVDRLGLTAGMTLSERMKALNADPEFNPLAALTEAERADYDILRCKGGFSRRDALMSIGRGDLVRGKP